MKLIKQGTLAASCALLAAFALPAQATSTYSINDLQGHGDGTFYMGSNDHNYGDVIGSLGSFSIEGMNVSRTGNTLNVSIVTNFAGKGDDCLFGGNTCNGNTQSNLTNGLGIGYGDLFLASTWAPSGTEPYQLDNNSNGTIWEYGFSLNDRWSTTGNNLGGTLYKLNSANNNADALLSENFLTSGTFRNGQEVAVDINNDGGNANVTAVAGNSNWSVDNSTIDFSIDLTGTDLADTNSTFALHWAMTCANDTIEGSALLPSAVPVPAAVWLFGSGLLGLVGVARRRKHS